MQLFACQKLLYNNLLRALEGRKRGKHRWTIFECGKSVTFFYYCYQDTNQKSQSSTVQYSTVYTFSSREQK